MWAKHILQTVYGLDLNLYHQMVKTMAQYKVFIFLFSACYLVDFLFFLYFNSKLGIRYFECEKRHGIFVRPNKLILTTAYKFKSSRLQQFKTN